MTTVPAKFIFDSSAWIEYFIDAPSGLQIQAILDNPDNIILTPNIVCGEIISKLARAQKPTQHAVEAIQLLSVTPFEERQDYFSAGVRHAELRKKFKNASLADAIILVLAEKNNAKIVTKDSHLKGKNTVFIG